MGVSKNRKGQKVKSRQRTLILKNQKAKAQKELMKMIQKSQEEHKSEENDKNVIGLEEVGEVGIDNDFDLDNAEFEKSKEDDLK